jgi:hypothetical protein
VQQRTRAPANKQATSPWFLGAPPLSSASLGRRRSIWCEGSGAGGTGGVGKEGTYEGSRAGAGEMGRRRRGPAGERRSSSAGRTESGLGRWSGEEKLGFGYSKTKVRIR